MASINDSKLANFTVLLYKASARTNLISPQERENIQSHILDSLLISPHLPEDPFRLLDIGSGGGFPVIPLAIQHPEGEFLAIDASKRKCDFLELVKMKLSLQNLTICHGRIEDQKDLQKQFQVITARAFKPLHELIEIAFPYLEQSGSMLFLKGTKYPKEIAEAEKKMNELKLLVKVEEVNRETSGRELSAVLRVTKKVTL